MSNDMKNQSQDRTLGDLFAAARAEEKPDLLTTAEASRLVRDAHPNDVPLHPSMFEQVKETMFGTPLRFGATAMTTTGLLTIGFIAAHSLFFSPEEQSPQRTTHSLSSAIRSEKSSTKALPEILGDAVKHVEHALIHPKSPSRIAAVVPILPPAGRVHSEPIAPKAPVPPTPVVAVDSLQPIDLTPDQLAQMGVEMTDDGNISFYRVGAETKNDQPMPVLEATFFPTFGSSMRMELDTKPKAGAKIVAYSPKLVTSPTGARRFFSFGKDDGSMFMASTMDDSTGDHFSKSSRQVMVNVNDDESGNPSSNRISVNTQVSTNGGDSHSVENSTSSIQIGDLMNVDVKGDVDEDGQNENANISMNFSRLPELLHPVKDIPNIDSLIGSLHLQGNELKKNVKIKIGTKFNAGDDIDSNFNFNFEFNTDSVMQHAFKGFDSSTFNFNFDNSSFEKTLKNAKNAFKFEFNDSTMQIEPGKSNGFIMKRLLNSHGMCSDSVWGLLNKGGHFDSSMSKFAFPQFKGMDSTLSHLLKRKFSKDSNVFRFNRLNDLKMLPGRNGIHGLDSIMRQHIGTKGVQIFVNGTQTDFNHLIPVRVKNTLNPAKVNELIFWYDSIPQIETFVADKPHSKVESVPNHVSLSVYPNPTNGPVTVHYELKDAQRAEFSVHNLLGQKMLDGGSTSGLSGDQTLDLSKLDAGVYLLNTTTDTGDRSVERIVVTK